MGLPGHRRTSSDKRRRAAHFALEKVVANKCSSCGAVVLPHHACKACGFYKGRKVVENVRAAKRLVKKTTKK